MVKSLLVLREKIVMMCIHSLKTKKVLETTKVHLKMSMKIVLGKFNMRRIISHSDHIIDIEMKDSTTPRWSSNKHDVIVFG